MHCGSVRSIGSIGAIKKLKIVNFFGSDGSVIQSDRVCTFLHCDTTRALTTLESFPIRQPRLPTSVDGRCSGHEA